MIPEKQNGVYFQIESTKKVDQSDCKVVYAFCPIGKLGHVCTENDGRYFIYIGCLVMKNTWKLFAETRIKSDHYQPDKSMHNLRITGKSMLNGMLFVSDQKSVLNQSIVDVDHAAIGALVDASVRKITQRGIFLKIYQHINGFVPKMFLDLVGGEKMRSRYALGSSLKVSVVLFRCLNSSQVFSFFRLGFWKFNRPEIDSF